MRMRVALAIVGTVVGVVLAAFAWRIAFPFPDSLAGALSGEVLAYVHVNVTLSVRRQVRSLLPRFSAPMPPEAQRALTAELRSPHLREASLGLIRDPDGTLRWELLIASTAENQRVGDVTFALFGIPGKTRNVRSVRTGGSSLPMLPPSFRWHPVQTLLQPRALVGIPLLRLRSAAPILPETVAAAGTIDRLGIVLSTATKNVPGTFSGTFFNRRDVFEVPSGAATVHVRGLPVRAITSILEAPSHRALLAALAPVLPTRASLSMDFAQPSAVLQFSTPHAISDDARAALLGLLAILFPSDTRTILDGVDARVAVADVQRLTVQQTSDQQWVVRSPDSGEHIATASVDHGQVTVAVGRSNDFPPTPAIVRMPKRCMGEREDVAILSTNISHPQAVASITFPLFSNRATICGFFNE